MTINVRERLLRLHWNNRRMRIGGYVKQAVARFAKADIETIKIDPLLSQHLLAKIAKKPISFKVTVEKLEGRVNVKLPGAPKAQAKPAAKVEAKAPEAKIEAKPEKASVKPEAKASKAESAKTAPKPTQEQRSSRTTRLD